MSGNDPTYLGRVSAVSGSSITVKLSESLSSGLAMIAGHTYRVGQVGSFVRIPLGYQDLFGVVAEVGAAGVSGGTSGRCCQSNANPSPRDARGSLRLAA